MAVVRLAELPVSDFHGAAVRQLAPRADEAGELTIFRSTLPAGTRYPLHFHDHEEVVVVLDGSATCMLDGLPHAVRSGDAAIVPANAVHSLLAETVVELLAIFPAGTRMFAPDGTEIDLA